MKREIMINGLIPGYPQGSVAIVQCDDEGTPLESFWRRQLKSAEQDGCCEFIKVEKKLPTVTKRRGADKGESE